MARDAAGAGRRRETGAASSASGESGTPPGPLAGGGFRRSARGVAARHARRRGSQTADAGQNASMSSAPTASSTAATITMTPATLMATSSTDERTATPSASPGMLPPTSAATRRRSRSSRKPVGHRDAGDEGEHESVRSGALGSGSPAKPCVAVDIPANLASKGCGTGWEAPGAVKTSRSAGSRASIWTLWSHGEQRRRGCTGSTADLDVCSPRAARERPRHRTRTVVGGG